MSGTCDADLARGLEAGHARHRHVEHRDVGVLRLGGFEGAHAVGGLGHHLHVGLAVDQHAQAGADDAVVVGDQDADHRILSVTEVPPFGAERTSSSPPTSRARSAMPRRPSPCDAGIAGARGAARVEAAAVVADAQLGAVLRHLQLHLDDGGSRVALGVGERLLRHAVDGGLGVLPERLHVALGLHPHLDPGAGREALELRVDRGDEPVVVERRGAQLAREVEQLVHRLVHEPLELGHLLRVRGRGLLGQRLEAQQDRRKRLVHLVVEVAGQPPALLLLRAHHELTRAAALLLHALEQAPERLGQPADLLGRALRGEVERAGCGRIDLLDALDQALERAKAPLEHPHVHAQREHDRERQHQELPAFAGHLDVEAGHEARGQQRERDEKDIGGHDLADQRIVAARHSRSACQSESPISGHMGSPPHIGRGARRRESW